MRFLPIIFLSLLIFFGLPDKVTAQDTRSGDPNAIFDRSPSSRDAEPEKSTPNSAKKSNKKLHKKSFNQRMDQKVEEFEKRMKDNAKKYKKREKQMAKPQYSDPSYFGHKRKPKKRPPGKQKFCKECGIKH